MTPKQEELFDLEVRSLKGNSGEVSVIENLPTTLRKGKRSCVKYPISQYVCTNNLFNGHQNFIAATNATKILISFQEAMKSKHWTQAIREEIDALERSITWEIVDKTKD